jgi:hypothetical protein
MVQLIKCVQIYGILNRLLHLLCKNNYCGYKLYKNVNVHGNLIEWNTGKCDFRGCRGCALNVETSARQSECSC